MFIVTVGINYKTAPVEIREKVSFAAQDIPGALDMLKAKPYVEGCVILSTCNRSEIYVATTDVEKGLSQVKFFLSKSCELPVREIEDYIYVHTIYDAIRHLFKLVSGLDSMVLGETQILGQVRDAYQMAFECGATNAVLNMFFQQALTVGKKVRTQTGIDRHAVSISYVAVEMAKQRLGDLNGRNVLVVGAGEMSELTVRHMVANGATHVAVVNRSPERSQELASKFDGRVAHFSELSTCLEEADIVISATAAQNFVISASMVHDIMTSRERPLFMIDIAVPRDIDPAVGALPRVTLLDIDDLRHVVDRNLEERKQAAAKAAVIIENEIEDVLKMLGSRFVVPTIVAFKEKVEAIRDAELERAMHRLGGLSPREQKVVQTMASQIVNQIMHDPVVNLKEYASTHQGHMYAEIFQNLFNLKIAGQKDKDGTRGQA
jgi:glutamyl-tRNA reductase